MNNERTPVLCQLKHGRFLLSLIILFFILI